MSLQIPVLKQITHLSERGEKSHLSCLDRRWSSCSRLIFLGFVLSVFYLLQGNRLHENMMDRWLWLIICIRVLQVCLLSFNYVVIYGIII